MNKNEPMPKAIDRLINIALLPLALLLALAAFFALQEVLLTLSARVIVATVDSSVQGKYALVSVRNFWLLGGGVILVAVFIYVLDFAFKHWRTRRFRRLALRVLVIEVVIIGAQLVFFS